jgi:hypothetical protein
MINHSDGHVKRKFKIFSSQPALSMNNFNFHPTHLQESSINFNFFNPFYVIRIIKIK